MVRAWLYGVLVLIIVHLLLWGVVAQIPFSELLRNVLFAGPPAASLLTAYLSPRHRFLMGMSLAPCGALIGYAAQLLYAAFGYHVDRLGVDALSTLQVLLVFNVLYAVIGSLLGILLRWALAKAQDSAASTTT